MNQWSRAADFDQYSSHYDSTINEALSLTGCTRDYFARARIEWLARRLDRLRVRPTRVMDFGCGPGLAAPVLFDKLGIESYIGVDTSADSVSLAARASQDRRSEFQLLADYVPVGDVDLAYCNGVFHHIRPEERGSAVEYIHRSLRPGGLFALWENNPLNPGTRYVMSRIPFDKGAVTLRAGQARRLIERGGFHVVAVDYLFIFPGPLALLRGMEPYLCRLPIGAQYQVLCRKP
jgi:SAM-dependent methyltransferase